MNKQGMNNVIASRNRDQIPLNQPCRNQNITATATSELHPNASFVNVLGYILALLKRKLTKNQRTE